jgi:hypothetical protein
MVRVMEVTYILAVSSYPLQTNARSLARHGRWCWTACLGPPSTRSAPLLPVTSSVEKQGIPLSATDRFTLHCNNGKG